LGRDVSDPEKLQEVISNATGQGTVPAYAEAGAISQLYSDAPTLSPTPVQEVDFSSMLEDSAPIPAPVDAPPVTTEAPVVADPTAADPLATATPEAPTAGPVDFDTLLND
jgi:hypothetical protein